MVNLGQKVKTENGNYTFILQYNMTKNVIQLLN